MTSLTTSSSFPTPKGFATAVANVGIKDASDDFVCIVSNVPCTVAGVFTQSRFAGPSVQLSRENIRYGQSRAIVAISKNANVATGAQGEQDACDIASGIANALGIDPREVLLASTGVIGRRYPMDKIMPQVRRVKEHLRDADFKAAARGIMTTDLVPKIAVITVGDAVLVGIAKGVGMMEPNMATLLAFFMTDAAIDQVTLDKIFRTVMDKSFNCLSIDTDTSTSDTALILANGLAGPVDPTDFEAALLQISLQLVKAIAGDGEGATKIIEVTVDRARDARQAKRVAKAVVNSPLVKTAIHGADANWGRVAMAIGKCEDEMDIAPDKVTIRFGDMEVYPQPLDEHGLARLTQMLQEEEILIHISLGTGPASATVWGCDLSAEYVRINGEYTT